MPYLMRTRSGSTVFHDSVYRMPAAMAWLERYNQSHGEHATLFHVFAYACGQALLARPELNRFVSGGRLYQRRGVQISFVVKREMSDSGIATTAKVDVAREEPLPEFVARIKTIVGKARGPDRAVDKETALVMKLPGPLVRVLVAAARLLDAWNLYPRFMTANDPMYASLFLANLGSAGISDAYHHLYEYGTVSIFGVVSALRPTPFVEPNQVVVSQGLSIRWTFDERIHDAYYAARSLAIVKRVLENPTRFLGDPEGTPVFAPTALVEDADAAP
jgi:pyruvate/2-oxoglutarate dehydrogenase complex dihydrolipoamide acyltransferase (E2) component